MWSAETRARVEARGEAKDAISFDEGPVEVHVYKFEPRGAQSVAMIPPIGVVQSMRVEYEGGPPRASPMDVAQKPLPSVDIYVSGNLVSRDPGSFEFAAGAAIYAPVTVHMDHSAGAGEVTLHVSTRHVDMSRVPAEFKMRFTDVWGNPNIMLYSHGLAALRYTK